MQRSCVIVSMVVLAGCGLRSGGQTLPDGGSVGTAAGCNKRFDDGHRVVEPGEAPFANINALQFDSEGNLYVLNRTASASWVSVFGPSPNNDFRRVLGRSVLRDGIDLAVAGDRTLWVLEDFDGPIDVEVVHLNEAGEKISSFSLTVSEVGGLALAGDGGLFVSVGRIAELSPDGGVVNVFGSKPPSIPHYMGMAFDAQGRLWATDPISNTVERFERDGVRISKFGERGPGPGMFDGTNDVHAGPSDIAFNARGEIYVNDPFGSRIMKFSQQGTMLGEFGFGGGDNVEPVAVDPRSGNVYVGRDNGVDIVCPL